MSATKEHFHDQIEAGMRESQSPLPPFAKGDETHAASLPLQREYPKGEGFEKQHKIQWLNLPGYKGETWNPIIGCSKISDGCKNCYAEKMAMRLQHMPQAAYYSGVLLFKPIHDKEGWAGNTVFVESQLTKPATWKAPRVVFVCSMGDLFHETVSFETINAVFSVMADCSRHIFIVLTKRPERMLEFYNWKSSFGIPWIPSSNVWVGVTAENQYEAINRIAFLNIVYAAVKFVSIEPMLSAVDLNDTLQHSLKSHAGGLKNCLSWVICGGESGHNARPVHPDWVRSLRDQCQAAGVPFFFKQWGEYKPFGTTDGRQIMPFPYMKYNTETKEGFIKVGKHRSGNLLDGKKYEQYPRDFTPALKGDYQNMISKTKAPFRAGGENQQQL